MLVVMALGGNALLRRDEPLGVDVQRQNILAAVAKSVAPIAREHRLVITHGNGPQIGLLALQAASCKDVQPFPLDVLGAESEGMIGYLIEQTLVNELADREIATLLTQVEVDESDRAFAEPSKPIGPTYAAAEAQELARRTSWKFAPDGRGFRRVVPSPSPLRIREINIIKRLVSDGVVTICAGGGGIPVVGTATGGIRGVEAVIDKDLSAALLAEAIDADVLLLLTDVPAVWTQWPMSRGHPIGRTTVPELRNLQFAAGSMGSKVEAACRFVERTGRTARIGSLDQAQAILSGDVGTVVAA
jgi:carbamate kinase